MALMKSTKTEPELEECEGFEDLPLFGGSLEVLQKKPKAVKRKKRRKRRKKKKSTKKKIKQIKKAGQDLPLFSWFVPANLEGENADFFRNVIRSFMKGKWELKEDWNEPELFSYFMNRAPDVPIACFIKFWKIAIKSDHGKLLWVNHLDSITEEDWKDYVKLVHKNCDSRWIKKARQVRI